jgi:hypothetical protein
VHHSKQYHSIFYEAFQGNFFPDSELKITHLEFFSSNYLTTIRTISEGKIQAIQTKGVRAAQQTTMGIYSESAFKN